MILFIQRSTGLIIGYISGRTHPKEVLDNAWMHVDNIDKNDVAKYVVPLGDQTEDVEEPVFDLVPSPTEPSKMIRAQVGTQITKKVVAQVPSGPLADLALMSEQGGFNTSEYKVLIENNKVIGYEKLDKKPSEAIAKDQDHIIDLSLPLDEIKATLPPKVQLAIDQINKISVKEVGFADRDWFLFVVDNSPMPDKDKEIAHRLCSLREPFNSGTLRMYVATLNETDPMACALVRIDNDNQIYYLGSVTEMGVTNFAFEKLIWGLIIDSQSLDYKKLDITSAYRYWTSSID